MSKPDSTKHSQTHWAAVDARTDRDLQDPEHPLLDDRFWADAVFVPRPKQQVPLRLDPGVLALFREQGPRYPRRSNAVLRQYMNAVRPSGR